jgi:hypothetical protein
VKHFRLEEIQKQVNPKCTRMKEIIKIRAKKSMNWRSKEQYNERKSLFFEK